jgi:hypothetical protein
MDGVMTLKSIGLFKLLPRRTLVTTGTECVIVTGSFKDRKKFPSPQKTENLWTSQTTISFSIKTLLHGVTQTVVK